ncbi:hypothetical protein VTK26DRAFT_1787 [Humicola hyalothermophila]
MHAPAIRTRRFSYASHGTQYGFDLSDHKAHSFHGLLLTCRDIHAEAVALLYSANRFAIYYSNPGSSGPLLSLSAVAFSSLTALKVVLNEASCHRRLWDPNPDASDCCLKLNEASYLQQLRDPYPFSSLIRCLAPLLEMAHTAGRWLKSKHSWTSGGRLLAV